MTEESPIKGRLSLKRRIVDSDTDSNDVSSPLKRNAANSTPKKTKTITLSPNGKESDDNNSKMAALLEKATWKKGEKVPYLALTDTMSEIEKVSKRLEMIEILSNYLYTVMELTPEDVLPSIYLCLNKLAPDYEGIETGVGEGMILKALAGATGRAVKEIKRDVEKQGDLGLVAESSRSKQRMLFQPKRLTVRDVFDRLREVAAMSGKDSGEKKTNKIQGLIVACKETEARYLVRSLNGKLRIGLAEQSLLVALGQAAVLHENKTLSRKNDKFKEKAEKAVDKLKATYAECPNYDKVVKVMLEHGIEQLAEHCKITPGVPVKPMLAHPTKGVAEVLKRFENNVFTCEHKYDGERAQVHLLEDGTIKIYSRNQEDNTPKYPDIVSRIPQVIKPGVTSFIIDSEAVAWDIEAKSILPFQVLSTRKRKDVKEEDVKVKVCMFAFDMLYLNGKPLNREPLRVRRDHLFKSFESKEGVFMFAQSKDVTTTEEIQELIDVAVKEKCEGLMVKCLDNDATYEIAKRSRNWLKVSR